MPNQENPTSHPNAPEQADPPGVLLQAFDKSGEQFGQDKETLNGLLQMVHDPSKPKDPEKDLNQEMEKLGKQLEKKGRGVAGDILKAAPSILDALKGVIDQEVERLQKELEKKQTQPQKSPPKDREI